MVSKTKQKKNKEDLTKAIREKNNQNNKTKAEQKSGGSIIRPRQNLRTENYVKKEEEVCVQKIA